MRPCATATCREVTASQADGVLLLAKARRVVVSAEALLDSDPDSAYVLAYDAARHAGVALLAQQGLRATSKGGHYVVERVLRAQFGPGFRSYSTLRRRRNELEYPRAASETSDQAESARAVLDARAIIDAAADLLPQLGRWHARN